MDFPAFSFKQLAETEWEDNIFGNHLHDQCFFFVIYREGEDGQYRLLGNCFLNMPYQDIEGPVREVWERTRDIFKDGTLLLDIDAWGIVHNNLPNPVIIT